MKKKNGKSYLTIIILYLSTNINMYTQIYALVKYYYILILYSSILHNIGQLSLSSVFKFFSVIETHGLLNLF